MVTADAPSAGTLPGAPVIVAVAGDAAPGWKGTTAQSGIAVPTSAPVTTAWPATALVKTAV
jgi:hypothetical protein